MVDPARLSRKDNRTVRPRQLALRCYIRKSGRVEGRWVAHCIDLDLWAVGSSLEGAKKSLEEAILGYLETVLETEDRESIPRLLQRRAPLGYIALWHLIRLMTRIRHDGNRPLGGTSFEEPIPFRLAAA